MPARMLWLIALMILPLGPIGLAPQEKKDPLPVPGEKKDPPPEEKSPPFAREEQLLKQAKIDTAPEALLAFLRRRTLPDSERPLIAKLIRQLGSEVYREREQASRELLNRGPVVAEMLRAAMEETDLELALRAEKCLQRILERDVSVDIPAAAVRLVAHKKPKGAAETLLGYLPFADNDQVAEEVRAALAALAVRDGKAHPAFVAGLTDPLATRRAGAGEALIRAGLADHKETVRKLLADPDPHVRLRVSLALAYARDRDAIQVLIDGLPAFSLQQAWLAEDLLFRLAEGKSPPTIALGNNDATRKKCRDAWNTWWNDHKEAINLAKLQETPPLLGYTLVVLLDQGKVMELGADNQPRWQIDNLIFPLDVQYLPGDRVLVAEYHANRITERNIKGEVLWQKRVNGGPLVAQRLANGNTFIITDSQMVEYDRADKEVLAIAMPEKRILKGAKLPNGEIACLTSDARVVRFDAQGKELFAFPVPLGMRLYGGRIHMLPSGRVLIPHHSENKVVEYDGQGKIVWEVAIEQPVAAVRLPGGNTLVTTMQPQTGAVEFDRAGKEIWRYRNTTRVTRALRR